MCNYNDAKLERSINAEIKQLKQSLPKLKYAVRETNALYKYGDDK